MKILHFAHTFIPFYGGTTTRLINLLSDTRNDHYLYVPMPDYKNTPNNVKHLKYREDFSNIKVRRCKLFKIFKIKIPIFKMLLENKINSNILIKSVKEEDFDIAHGHNPLAFATTAMKFAKKKDIPLIYEIHRLSYGAPINEKWKYVSNFFHSLKQRLFLPMEKKVLTNADVIIVHSKTVRRHLISIFGIDENNIRVIPNGIDSNKFNPNNWHKMGKELRRTRDWNNKVIFMYNGFLNDFTGIGFFLDSIKELPYSVKKRIKVLVIGRGMLQKNIENMSNKKESNIEYLGLINHNDMPKYYCASDVHVIPLIWNSNIPTKLLEGMAMEKIVLASNASGIKEILKNNKNGIIFNKGNKKDLLKKIGYIVNNIDKMNNIRKQARKDVVEKYDWGKFRQQLQKIYTNLVK